MPESAVHVASLNKIFRVPEREAGLRAAVTGLVRRKHREVRAVDEISFEIEPGEVVGFLGPNGAGKTTTLKMLSGLLYPTAGEARVLGHVPSKRERDFLRRITLVMGNRNQLQWDLPGARLLRAQPRDLPDPARADFTQPRDELIELLDLGDLVRKPVRNLSLGERMKVEIVGSLLHRPQVLFLDEPTIGLDVTMQKRIRGVHRRVQPPLRGDRAPDEPLHGGRRGALQARDRHPPRQDPLRRRARAARRPLRRVQDDRRRARRTATADLSAYGDVVERDGERVTLRVPRAETARVTARLLAEQDVADLTVEDPPIEDVIELVFAQERRE